MVIAGALRGIVRAAVEIGADIAAAASLAARHRWDRFVGRAAAFAEGRDTALCSAAMVAHGMGHPDVRQAINALMPDGSPFIPMDDPRYARRPGPVHVRIQFEDQDPVAETARAVAERVRSSLEG